MGEAKDDPLEVVRKLAETYRGIKFGAGVVGKTSYATIGLFSVWAIVLLRLSENVWLDIAMLAVGGVVTYVYFWWVTRTQAFAEKNPGLAVLEGAELIEYQKFEAEAKGLGRESGQPRIVVTHPKQLDRPDE